MKIEIVQRWVAAVILIHVGAAPATALAVYSPHLAGTDRGSAIGLWVMCGVIGLLTVGGVLLIHARSLLSPWLVLGVLPMAASAFFLF